LVGICGWSGAGKTTLIEALLPRLKARGLVAGVIKHDAHGLDLDTKGKDTDKLWRAGAEAVCASDGGQSFVRRRRHEPVDLPTLVEEMPQGLDVIIIEGHKDSDVPKVWVARNGDGPPPEVSKVIACVQRGDEGLDAVELVVMKAVNSHR
jgi:molybdopterin-guanine dinucleotide biosynthesis protein B